MLAAYPCRSECAWSPVDAPDPAGPPLFRCAGCGSEWTRAEPWTPAERDGSVSEAVAAQVARG